jgi:ABC-type transport system involved in multi-copper enzyme maturation permease subunit
MRTLTIATATFRESIRQPLFTLLILVAGTALMLFTVIPYFGFGEDIKMLKDTGLAVILGAGLLLAVISANSSIAEDIEDRTAITVLSKPVNRRHFIVGKFLGIAAAVGLLVLILGLIFCVATFYKVGYDVQENNYRPDGRSMTDIPREQLHWLRLEEVRLVLPGIVLVFFQVVVLTALSIAIATRFHLVVNAILCGVIFLLGNLVPVVVEHARTTRVFEPVKFWAEFLLVILPPLDYLNVSPAIATGSAIPAGYVALSALYCLCYSAAALLLALLLFEDRDLA